jgi:glucose-6-phosphate 1-dehydrogenase
LAELYDGGHLPPDFRVVAPDRQDWDDDTFRHHAAQHLEQHPAPDVKVASSEALLRVLH